MEKIDSQIAIQEAQETDTHIRRIIDKLREATISPHNFRTHERAAKNARDIITTQIENHQYAFKKCMDKHDKIMDTVGESRLRDMTKEKICPSDMYEQVVRANEHLREMVAWYIMINEIFYAIHPKTVAALGEAAQYELETEVMKRMTELTKQTNSQHNELVKGLINHQNDKIDLIKEGFNERIRTMTDQMRMYMQEMQRLQLQNNKEIYEQQWNVVKTLAPNNIDIKSIINEAAQEFNKNQAQLAKKLDSIQIPDKSSVAPTPKKMSKELPSSEPEPDVEESDEEYDVSTTEDFICPHCGEKFVDDIQLDTHIEVNHYDEE